MTGGEEKQIMIKKWIFYTSIALIVTFITSGFRAIPNKNRSWFYNTKDEDLPLLFPSQQASDYPASTVLFTGKSFTGFKEAIAFKESQGQYKLINTLGYMGKYQFGTDALRAIGINNKSNFLNSPQLQEKAFETLLSKNKWELRSEIEKYEGKIVAGIIITESGLLAAAHLGGAGSVKKFLKSNGKRFITDGYGTSLRSYIKRYSGYDTTHIVANDNASVN